MGYFSTTALIPGKQSWLRAAFFLAAAVLCNSVAHAQVAVTANQTAAALAQKLVGTGVIISNATMTCPVDANGIFVVTPTPPTGTNIGLDSGIILTSGRAATVGASIGANSAPALFATTSWNAAGDADLTTIGGQTTNDACKIEFDFIPAGDTIKFDYVFASEEYNGPHGNYNCSINDVFAFFISGPGITGSQNIALIPGTTIPVGVSTINDGVGAFPGNSCYTNTNGLGPFTGLYNVNTGNTITYTGYTDVLTAIKAVTPCTTYHLKIAIADASDWSWDSGVFLKAGSLTSNAIAITPVGGGGLSAPVPYCVRGCLPGKFRFRRPVPKTTPLTIKYLIQGTATNGTDYTQIPDSVVIPANDTVAERLIYGLVQPIASGPETVKLKILSPYSCGSSGNPLIIDSAELVIYDSLQVNIVTPDTAICRYQSVDIQTDGDNLLSYSWSPTAGLNDPTLQDPTATPINSTTYTVSATLAGSGCPAAHDHITITIKQPPVVNVGPDTTTCMGTPYTFNTTITPVNQTYTYSWTPSTGLNNPAIASPTVLATTVGSQTYVLTANPGASGCSGYDTVTVKVIPNDFTLYNSDTSICKGASVQVNAVGDAAYHYSWTPVTGVSNATILTPSLTPDTTTVYLVTASFPGCPDIVKSLGIDVQPNPIVYVGADLEKCQWDTLHLHGMVSPTWYTQYSYIWTAPTNVDDPNSKDIVYSGQSDETLTLTVKTPAGCTGSDDVFITVRQGNFASMTPEPDTGICPRDSVQMHATGGVAYKWSPADYLNDTLTPDPVSKPITDITYTVLVTDQYGCLDTLTLPIDVHPAAVLDLGETKTIYPGESVQMDPLGNCLYFNWTPPLGLSATNIANPVAAPPVNTRYFVIAATEFGCLTSDSVDVMVNEESVLDVPNAFSPGSQPNGEIKIVRRGLATLKYFRIFNRWGTMIFETNDLEKGWDGRYNGEPQPMGVYVYTVEAYTNTGRKFYKQGNITLIR